jgi:hypothetical protein
MGCPVFFAVHFANLVNNERDFVGRILLLSLDRLYPLVFGALQAGLEPIQGIKRHAS